MGIDCQVNDGHVHIKILPPVPSSLVVMANKPYKLGEAKISSSLLALP